jgi:hypothetical protein
VHCAALHCGRWALTHSLAGQCRTAQHIGADRIISANWLIRSDARRCACSTPATARHVRIRTPPQCSTSRAALRLRRSDLRISLRRSLLRCAVLSSAAAMPTACACRARLSAVACSAELSRAAERQGCDPIDSLWPHCAASQRSFWPQLRLLWWQPVARPSLRRRLRRRTSHTSAPSRTPPRATRANRHGTARVAQPTHVFVTARRTRTRRGDKTALCLGLRPSPAGAALA